MKTERASIAETSLIHLMSQAVFKAIQYIQYLTGISAIKVILFLYRTLSSASQIYNRNIPLNPPGEQYFPIEFSLLLRQHQLQQMFVLPNQKQGYLSCSINKQRPEQHGYLAVKTGNSIEGLQPF